MVAARERRFTFWGGGDSLRHQCAATRILKFFPSGSLFCLPGAQQFCYCLCRGRSAVAAELPLDCYLSRLCSFFCFRFRTIARPTVVCAS